ncbi:hypothetical protein J2Z76_001449 [Sedimentibacter acidaminivorans]|uniref:Uncharacterized protein n=1 Tax=Sedimentibacter acidaminivorans TaxID=913099 RepID=A0ABS4GDZ7_9FIRM|nr:hypothetical protein [Sedimentibacter acidaminivorans]MBP1925590.1 hypothetical protein [Sedimentibacter acidaminivorans]
MNYHDIRKIFNIDETYTSYSKRNYKKVNSTYSVFMTETPVNTETGFLEIYITKDLGREFPIDAVITIYTKQGDTQVPVKSLIATENPTIIELPVANLLGDLIESPEYFFTTYDLTIESLGYYKITTLNIRLFPNITTSFYYNLNKIIQGEPIEEEIINLPPHPRDKLINDN